MLFPLRLGVAFMLLAQGLLVTFLRLAQFAGDCWLVLAEQGCLLLLLLLELTGSPFLLLAEFPALTCLLLAEPAFSRIHCDHPPR